MLCRKTCSKVQRRQPRQTSFTTLQRISTPVLANSRRRARVYAENITVNSKQCRTEKFYGRLLTLTLSDRSSVPKRGRLANSCRVDHPLPYTNTITGWPRTRGLLLLGWCMSTANDCRSYAAGQSFHTSQ